MDSTPTLDDAILLAAQKHYGKKDKAGRPYVMHVLCVMFRLWSDEERIVGVLHDVVEETDVTLKHLKELAYPDRIVEAIDCLTWRKEQESYQRYIQRVKSNPLAATVKRADIKDHLTPSVDGRPGWLEQNHPDLHERYQKALQELGQWKVFGKDAFDVEAEMYPLGEYITENEAAEVAYKYLRELEEKQPTSSSGGQRLGGIQDRVFIQSPTGKLMQVMPEQGGKE